MTILILFNKLILFTKFISPLKYVILGENEKL